MDNLCVGCECCLPGAGCRYGLLQPPLRVLEQRIDTNYYDGPQRGQEC